MDPIKKLVIIQRVKDHLWKWLPLYCGVLGYVTVQLIARIINYLSN